VVGVSDDDVASDEVLDEDEGEDDDVVSSADEPLLAALVTWAAFACAPRTGSSPPLTRTHSSASTTRKIATLVRRDHRPDASGCAGRTLGAS
jgi:hypothetical protein